MRRFCQQGSPFCLLNLKKGHVITKSTSTDFANQSQAWEAEGKHEIC